MGHLDGIVTRPWMVLHHTPRLVWNLPSNSKGPHLAHEGDRPHEVGLFGKKYRGVFSVEQQVIGSDRGGKRWLESVARFNLGIRLE